MAEINDLDVTDANNTARFPEGMRVNAVNDSARALEAIIARGLKDVIDGSITSAGTTTAYTVASNRTLTAYYDGMTITVQWNATCGATPTVNVDSIGAKNLYFPSGTQVTTGDLISGGRSIIQYDGTNFQVLTNSTVTAVTAASTSTLTNKTLTSPVLNGTLSGTAFLDEDAMGSDSAIAAASQQSIKAYVDAAASSVDAAGAAASAAAALVSENAAAADAVLTAADVVLTNADVVSSAASAATALAAAQGWGAVTTLTTGTTNVEVANARTYYILDATGGTITVNMPAIGTSDGILFGFEVSNVDNAITIVRDGTDTINGVAGNYSGLISVGQVIHFIGDDTTTDNWLATIISQVGAASETTSGSIELATQAETDAGTDDLRAVTPLKLATYPIPVSQLAAGTDGELITWDAAGDPAVVAVGTVGQVLTSGGAGVAPTMQDAAAGGKVVQVVHAVNTSAVAGTTALPGDNTIPQITEGVALMELAITPTNSSNILYIESNLVVSYGSTEDMTIAMFQDSTANALACKVDVDGADQRKVVSSKYRMVAGTTSATTFKFRAGGTSGLSVKMNGVASSLRGGTIESTITITEVEV